MSKSAQVTEFKIGDRVRLIYGLLRGYEATVSVVHEDGSCCVIGDWTKQTGFVQVNYGPIEADCLQKV